MKYRILWNADGKYHIQKRIGLWWMTMVEDCGTHSCRLVFDTEHEARDYFSEMRSQAFKSKKDVRSFGVVLEDEF